MLRLVLLLSWPLLLAALQLALLHSHFSGKGCLPCLLPLEHYVHICVSYYTQAGYK